MPKASRLMTTPRMIWSTRYLIAKTASSAPTSPPVKDPATKPSQSTPTALATAAEAKAPVISCPSIAMLITPERSHKIPDSAPSTIGMAAVTVP